MLNRLNKIRDKFDEFNIYELNNIIIIISFILFLISIYYVKNVYIIIVMYLFILYIARNYEKNSIKFVSFLLPIIILGYFLIHFINFTFIEKETFMMFRIIIKVLMTIDCLCILYFYFKTKKVKLLNLMKRKSKKYTFKELRRKNLDKFRINYHNYVDEYLENNKIGLDSDYFKVIENNIDNKINENLDNYVWTNYLRFYKNKKYNKESIFNVFNLMFLGVHVIILVLILIVR